MRAGEFPFYRLIGHGGGHGRAPSTAWLQRASDTGECAVMFSVSWGLSWWSWCSEWWSASCGSLRRPAAVRRRFRRLRVVVEQAAMSGRLLEVRARRRRWHGYSTRATRAGWRGCSTGHGDALGGRGVANGGRQRADACGVQRRCGGDSGGCGFLSGKRPCLGGCCEGGDHRGASGGRGVVAFDGMVQGALARARHGISVLGAAVAARLRRLLGLGLLWHLQQGEGELCDKVM